MATTPSVPAIQRSGPAAAADAEPSAPVSALRRLFYELRYHQRTREQLELALQPGTTPIP